MIRSLLYVPANADRFVAKAHQRGADAIILDLEDAVAPNAKTEARERLDAAVGVVAQGGAQVFVRINSERERIFDDAAAACRAGAFGLYVPKVTSPEILVELVRHLEPVEAQMGREAMVFVPLIEDPGAVLDVRTIAKGPRVYALSAGGEDIATALGAEPTPEVLRLPKLLIHYAAKAEKVRSFGLLRSVADYSQVDAMREAALEARRFGFDGASCIHPSIVAILNEAFTPSEEEIAFARRVVEADAKAAVDGIGAYTVDGRFVDAPVVARAKAVLAKVTGLDERADGRE